MSCTALPMNHCDYLLASALLALQSAAFSQSEQGVVLCARSVSGHSMQHIVAQGHAGFSGPVPWLIEHFLRLCQLVFMLSLQALNALNDEERAALMAGRSLTSARSGAGPAMVSVVPHQQTMTAALVESQSPVASAASSHS